MDGFKATFALFAVVFNKALFVDVASLAEGDLKLVNGGNSFEGRVEIYHNNQWGTICYDGWDNDDAKVVCRQLGYAYGMAISSEKFGKGTSKVWMDDVKCEGSEVRLSDCAFIGWDSITCDSDTDAGVICNLDIYSSREGAVRLVNGSSLLEGRVEIFHNSTWKGVCNNKWNNKHARVICRQLGFVYGTATSHANFGQGSNAAWVNNVTCQGMEARMEYCPIKSWKDGNCDNNMYAGVSCTTDGSIRLRPYASNPQPRRGRLEIFYNNTWGTVCSNNWNQKVSAVVCKELGFPYGGSVDTPTENIGLADDPIWMSNVSCLGTEGRLSECSFVRENNCSHKDDISIGYNIWYGVRLVGGKTKREGRVEMFYPGQMMEWATICDNKWDNHDAAVVCRQLGYTGGLAKGGSFFGQGSSGIETESFECNGSEFLLYHCPKGDYTTDCSHSNDAGVICEPVDGSIRLVNGTSSSEGRLEVLHNGIWGTVCNNGWDMNDTIVACKELGYTSGGVIGNFGQGSGLTWMDNVKCQGDETRLSNCDFNGWGIENCSHMQDVSIVCTPDCNHLEILLPNGSSSFDEGQTVKFRCISSCVSMEEILYWNLITYSLRSYLTLLYRRGEELTLTLEKKHNNFNLRCGTAFNSTNVTLSVSFKPTSITLTPDTKSYNATERKEFGPISCSAPCNPVCSYTWNKVTSRNLSFASISRTDDGSYTCEARNRLGSITSQAIIINVQFPPNITTTKQLGSETKDIILSCDVKGNPEEYSFHGWIHKYGGQVIRDSTFPGFQGNRTLHLTALSNMDDGEYYCSVSNGIVNVMDEMVQTGVSTVLEIKVAPYGFNKLYSARAKVGERFIFKLPFVVSDGDITFEILNISSAENLKSSSRFQFYTVTDMHDVNMYSSIVRKHGYQLIVNVTQFAIEDAGTYVITLSNEIGRRNCQLRIEIELSEADGNSEVIMIGSTVGGAIVLLAVIVVIIILQRRGFCHQHIEHKSEENYNNVDKYSEPHHPYDRINKPDALYQSLREDAMTSANGKHTYEEEDPQSLYLSIREDAMDSRISGNTVNESQDGYLITLERPPEYSYADFDINDRRSNEQYQLSVISQTSGYARKNT